MIGVKGFSGVFFMAPPCPAVLGLHYHFLLYSLFLSSFQKPLVVLLVFIFFGGRSFWLLGLSSLHLNLWIQHYLVQREKYLLCNY